MDHFFIGLFLRRKIRFMAKSQLFGPPVLTYVYSHGGVFPVRRGHHDEEAFKTAFTILEQGEMLLVYAEGGRSRTGELGEVKPGIGRIALESGVPVVPVAIHGSESVRRWKRFRFPKVTIQFGEPISFPVEQEVVPRAPARGRSRDIRAGSRDVHDRAEAWPPPCRSGVPQWLVSRGGRSRGAGGDNLFRELSFYS